MTRPSLLIASKDVNATWLMLTLGTPWFGAWWEPELELLPNDLRPVRFDWDKKPVQREWN